MNKLSQTYYRKHTLEFKERYIKINPDDTIEIITFQSSKYENYYKYSKILEMKILKDYFMKYLPHSTEKDFDLIKNNLIKSMLNLKLNLL